LMSLTIRVNPTLCEGHGHCYATCPDVFYPDDEGNGQVRADIEVAPGSELAEAVDKAARGCPERAIVVNAE
jgi:ferredoxin